MVAGSAADLLALSLDTEERGIHCAAIEVKAVRSTDTVAAFREAKEQLRATIADGRFAVSPDKSFFSRMWLNRIAEAAIGVARESNFRLQADELDAIEEFRTNRALEWAGVGLIFGQGLPREEQHPRLPIMGDQVPVSMYSFPIEETLQVRSGRLGRRASCGAKRSSIRSRRTKKRARRSADRATADRRSRTWTVEPSAMDAVEEPSSAAEGPARLTVDGTMGSGEVEREAARVRKRFTLGTAGPRRGRRHRRDGDLADQRRRRALRWAHGDLRHDRRWEDAVHQERSQAARRRRHALLDLRLQERLRGRRFPRQDRRTFYDLWDVGAPFNPLALAAGQPGEREIERRVIELGDAMGTAAQTYPGMRLGHRQLGKLKDALRDTYAAVLPEGRQPTLLDLNEQLDDDLRGIIGDLTRSQIFKDGRPFRRVINQDAIFGLQKIPGVGFTTDLAAGFILSSLALTFLDEPQVANLVKYIVVIDEAHRVSGFKAVSTMLREGRSKGLAVILATQQPGDLPREAEANAQTKICFRLPSGPTAASASRLLGATDRGLAERIQALENGEAFVRFAGLPPTGRPNAPVLAGRRVGDDRQPDGAALQDDVADPPSRHEARARFAEPSGRGAARLSPRLAPLPGRPDLAWTRKKVAVFVDGAFWHGHPSAFTPGKSGAYWDEKIARNVRDRADDTSLRSMEWIAALLGLRNPEGCSTMPGYR